VPGSWCGLTLRGYLGAQNCLHKSKKQKQQSVMALVIGTGPNLGIEDSLNANQSLQIGWARNPNPESQSVIHSRDSFP